MEVAFTGLHAPMAEEKAFSGDDGLVMVECVAGNEKVGNAGFIFERDEAMPLGCAGPLPADDETGTCDLLTVRDGGKIGGSEKSPVPEARRRNAG